MGGKLNAFECFLFVELRGLCDTPLLPIQEDCGGGAHCIGYHPMGVTEACGVRKLVLRLYLSQFVFPNVSLRYFTVLWPPPQRQDMAFHRLAQSSSSVNEAIRCIR